MLKVNVGLSRKLSKDYNSRGFTLNLEGEVSAPLDDPEAVIERIKEFYDLAEDALDLQIRRSRGDEEMARRDQEPANHGNGHSENRSHGAEGNGQNGHANGPQTGHSNGSGQSDPEPASNKQVQFLLNLGKRHRMSVADLERKASQLIGRTVGVYELTKRDAAKVIDALNEAPSNERPAARR